MLRELVGEKARDDRREACLFLMSRLFLVWITGVYAQVKIAGSGSEILIEECGLEKWTELESRTEETATVIIYLGFTCIRRRGRSLRGMPVKARSRNVRDVRNGDLHPFQHDSTTVRSSCSSLLQRSSL